MSNTPTTPGNAAPSPAAQLEKGTYEIIRGRLLKQTDDLRNRLNQLNSARKTVFGAIETSLIANDRINTQNHCIARDIVAIQDHCIFGYNVHIGLRSGINLNDVFSVYRFENNSYKETDLRLIQQEKFETDFQNLYRYYRDAFFARFIQQGSYLFMVFQLTHSASDFKAFKWLIKDDELVYIDARSEHEIEKKAQHEFQWQRAHRDHHRTGRHPHVSILDRLFVETVGGDLTIKIEDNTDDGLGIYREEVEYKDQTLDDAEYLYADLGNLIALKIRPYQEDFRYFVYNEKIQQVIRVDTLEDSGILLPDNHGMIFANGYYLQTGDYKIFDPDLKNMLFQKRIVSPNGEDFIFVFYNAQSGAYILHKYNLIEQKVDTPISCNGFTLFPDGELCYFKAEEEPTKHHVIQIWQTPFVSGDEVPSEHMDTYIYKIGNKDIVKAMAECTEIITLANKDDSYADLYVDLAKKCTDVLDSYYWIDKEETFQLNSPLIEIRSTATSAIEEYEKKIRIQRNTEEEIERVRNKASNLFQKINRQTFDSVDLFVNALAELRQLRGEIVSLRDLRYTDPELIEQLESEAAEKGERLSESCVRFLLEDEALSPYHAKVNEQRAVLEHVKTASEAQELEEAIDGIGEELQLLIDIVSNLRIEDATQTTRIIDQISLIYAELNQVKAAVKRHRNELMSTEAQAEFNAQLKLLDQGIINFLDVADTPPKCDEYLTKLVVQLEELESKFAEFDGFIELITEKREEIYNAFESRKKQLIEALNNRTASLQRAADRILNGIQNRIKSIKEVTEINAFFASDLMIEKVQDIIKQLLDLEDSNKAGTIQTRLKTIKEEAVRQLRDTQDLYVAGQNVIKFGKHHFNVNVQPLDLTTVQRDGKLYFHLTGTDFYEEITDETLQSTQEIWNQSLPSENNEVYRSEYLAFKLFQSGKLNNIDPENLDQLKVAVKAAASTRYEEGYTKGIHDEDAAYILRALLEIDQHIDLLKYSPDVRAIAKLAWHELIQPEKRALLQQQLESAGLILNLFPNTKQFEYLLAEIQKVLGELDV